MFIDTHCHLTDKHFENDIEKVLSCSKDFGVSSFITSGYDFASSVQAVEFALHHQGVYASIGVYPEFAPSLDEQTLEKIKDLAQNKKVVAIGEIGLQFTENCPPKEEQIKAFEKQIELAYSLKKPIVVHAREAMGAVVEVLEKNREKLVYGGTMHCYSGSLESAYTYIYWGCIFLLEAFQLSKMLPSCSRLSKPCRLKKFCWKLTALILLRTHIAESATAQHLFRPSPKIWQK